MGDIVNVNFETKRKVLVSVCDGLQNYQTFEAYAAEAPEVSWDHHDVWYGEEKVDVSLSHRWSPAVIKGPTEIADAIKNGDSPVRVTWEHKPRKDCWWELHECYLSTQSSGNTHVIVFRSATRHEF